MLHPNHQGFICDCYDFDSTVSSSLIETTDNFDQLLTLLLNMKPFVTSHLFPAVVARNFDELLDKLSALGRAIPYKPPTPELVLAVQKFVRQVRENYQLVYGVEASTRHGLSDLSKVVRDF